MFAVIFELEGQLDCSLHATLEEANAEQARLSEKYSEERTNYSASLAVQEVTPPAQGNPTADAGAQALTVSVTAGGASEHDWDIAIEVLEHVMWGDGTSDDEDKAIRRVVSAYHEALRQDGGAQTPSGEIWLSTIIRKGWEPRLTYATSEGELIADALQYASEVAEIDISEAASMAEIADALGEQANEQLYWERAR